MEAREALSKPRRSCGYWALRWKPGGAGRMDGAVAGVSRELSLYLERRVATEVAYLRMSVPGRNGMLLPGTVMWL